MEKNEVNEAFEILLEEIEVVANALNEEGAQAFRDGNYEKARITLEGASRLADFREKVKMLQKEWAELLLVAPRNTRGKAKKRRTKTRLPRGLRTPEDVFRRPILESLVELGGSATIRDVMERVEQKMKGILNTYDYQSLPSNPRVQRWFNTAQWCRNTLVREGLMRDDSPYGIWEISEQGRNWLQQQADN